MKISALLTSAGINIGLCALFLSLYSVLRKQPGNVSVYFGRRLAQEHSRYRDSFILERFVPSPSWIVKAYQYKEEEILSIAGLDAVVFLRLVVFSIRIFSIAAVVCVFGILPLNYFGQDMQHHVHIPSESLDAFTIGNMKMRSPWLWVHCLALYIISLSACVLLYYEYKSIARMRLVYFTRSLANPSHFTVLVRGIPKSSEEPFTDAVKNFFTKYHGSSYLSHQMVYRVGKVQKIMTNVEKVYKKFVHLKDTAFDQRHGPHIYRCGLCGGTSNTFQLYRSESDLSVKKTDLGHFHPNTEEKECSAAFVFFRTRYAANVASQVLQTSNPMLWVTDLAPEPHDVYWSNLWLPYRQLWIRRIGTLLGSIVFMFLFLVPVTFVQGLSQLDQLQQVFPFLKGILKKTFVSQLVTGYLPSVILQLFLYTVPPTMMLFSALEGPISHSGRKKSACLKVLYFTIWNVFFVNVLSGSIISQLSVISSPKEIPTQLAKAVPRQILNVYCAKYETGGLMWPTMHNTTVFSLVLAQIIALGVFGIKESSVAAGFTIVLVILTLLFNEYCRQRFHPIFESFSAQDLIEMDTEDEQSRRMEEIHRQLHPAYCQFPPHTQDVCDVEVEGSSEVDSKDSSRGMENDFSHPTLPGLPVSRLRRAVSLLSVLINLQNGRLLK
uniref:CSC1-like protein RXW8 isoform X2 n=1 Tax=Elaeis guineensis var. tenera TaxID=51953 RepID=A0A6I9SIS8_ELAGV|nr:CSC1-like protein RXW8 isoform X2 [Elaeis guineensis]